MHGPKTQKFSVFFSHLHISSLRVEQCLPGASKGPLAGEGGQEVTQQESTGAQAR